MFVFLLLYFASRRTGRVLGRGKLAGSGAKSGEDLFAGKHREVYREKRAKAMGAFQDIACLAGLAGSSWRLFVTKGRETAIHAVC
jgi:hypothetical protein